MKAKRGIIVVAIAVAALAASLAALSYVSYMKEFKEFIADGYILKPSEEVNVTTEANEQYYFSQGTKYKAKHGTKILFKDTAGEDVTIDTQEFVHYADNSLGAFTKGVIMDVTDINAEQYGYYNLTQNTILVKNGKSYEVSTRGEAMTLDEFIWKISDTDYMIVSPEITLELGSAATITLPEYAQIKYVDNGIVRIVHQSGTYQTISAESFLVTAGGAELNLAGKSFYANGKPVIHLDKISLNDDTYIELDANTDEPTIKIPQFNVVNGKDGASGANGANGESGEDGTDGTDGVDGGDGSEGMEGLEGKGGSSGGSGGRGTDGSDGLEGDSGVLGYDGKNGGDGTNGEDGKREDEASGIVSAEVYTRPTVNMETEGYKVTPNSLEMHLNLLDLDSALVPGKTEVVIYDRETMKEAATLPSWGEDLYNQGSVVINTSDLAPDREYILIVKGEYYAEGDDAQTREANLFTKVFRTNSLGVTLEKQSVTDSSVTVRAKKIGQDVNYYGVRLYYYEGDNIKEVGTFTRLNAKSMDLTFAKDSPTGAPEIKSNTLYYAVLSNIELAGVSGSVSTAGTEIEIKTLKKKPYEKATGGAVSTIVPVLAVDNKESSATLSVQSEIADEDNGVTGYRYELYRADEVNNAKLAGDLSGLIPAYVVQTDHIKDQKFQLDPTQKDSNGQPIEYVGRVIVLFGDNEKSNEYATNFSRGDSLSETEFPIVTFEKVQKTTETGGLHDFIDGYVRVNDKSGLLTPYIFESTPMLLTLESPYDQAVPMKLFTQTTPGSNLYYFRFDGLRRETPYTLSLQGPVDTNGDRNVTSAELLTALGGTRVVTTEVKAMKLVASMETVGENAFTMRINLAAGEDGALSSTQKAFYDHEAKTMEQLRLTLISKTIEAGKEKETVLGTPVNVMDLYDHNWASIPENQGSGGVEPEWKLASEFYDKAWVNNEAGDDKDIKFINDDSVQNGIRVGYQTTNPKKDFDDKLLLTPGSFGVPLTDSVFYSGATFIIRAELTQDYTGHVDNDFGFTEQGKEVQFVLEQRHVRASNPNDQVRVISTINNEEAGPHLDDPDGDGIGDTITNDERLDDKTVVGIKFQSSYPYGDIDKITYYIYALDDDQDAPGTDVEEDLLYSTNASKGAGWDVLWADSGHTKKLGELVATVVHKPGNGDTGSSETRDITLYFSDPQNPLLEGQKAGNLEGSFVSGKELKRGGRYIIAYSVDSNWKAGFDCDHDKANDQYPACTYIGETSGTPLYRSDVIDLKKQAPKVQRYPWTSSDATVTWKYRIIDPDQTVVKAESDPNSFYFYVKQKDSPALESVEKIKYKKPVGNYIGKTKDDIPFEAIDFEVNNNNYYSVLVEYKDLTYENAPVETVESIPIFKQGIVTSFATGAGALELKGLAATAGVTPDKDKAGDSGLEKAIVNEGGYRYRITLRGGNVENVAALRVTFTDAGGSGKSVVYDPVYVKMGTHLSTAAAADKWATAYVDCSALKVLKDAEINKVNVSVEAYYTTRVSGFSDYNTDVKYDSAADKNQFAADKADLQLYAMRKLEDSGVYTYRMLASKDGGIVFSDTDTEKLLLNNSVFLPRNLSASADGIGLEDGTGTVKTPSIGFRQAEKALALLSLDKKSMFNPKYDVEFDKDGLRIKELKDCVTVERLARTEPLAFTNASDTSSQVDLNNLFPGIREINTDDGVTGLFVRFRAEGAGAQDGVRLYARIAELDRADGNWKWMKIYRLWENQPGQKYDEYYMVDSDVTKRYTDSNGTDLTYYSKDKFQKLETSAGISRTGDAVMGSGEKESGIALVSDGAGGYTLPLRIKGLRPSVKTETDEWNQLYHIVIFAYDSTGEIVDLYSYDGDYTGFVYEKKTARNVRVKLTGPFEHYDTYNNKYFNFGFQMADGETGTGIEVYYQLTNEKDETIIFPATTQEQKDAKLGYIPPKTAGSLIYYPQISENNEISISMAPGGKFLEVGHSYTLKVIARTPESMGGELLSTDDNIYKVTVPSIKKLDSPTVRLSTSKGVDGGGNTKITANVAFTDKKHSMISYTVSVYDMDNGEALVGQVTQDVRDYTLQAYSDVLDFPGITSGHKYLVKVEATVDQNNDGIPDTTVSREVYQTVDAQPTAVLKGSFSGTTLNVEMRDRQNFSFVKSVQYIVYTASGASVIASGDVDLPANYTISCTGSWTAGTDYLVQIQYYDGPKSDPNRKVIGDLASTYVTY